MNNIPKIVYILVSSTNDLYYEQTYLSLISLRKVMPNIFVTLLTDRETTISLTGFRSKILELVNEQQVIEINSDYSSLQKSRYLKTKMRDYVTGDLLYIDGDTLVCEDLSEIFTYTDELYAVLDIHQYYSKSINKEYLQYKVSKLGWHAAFNDCHFNGGLMFSRDSEKSHIFFELWHNLWLESVSNGINFDQSSLNEANYRLNGVVHELDGTWNCQVAYGLNYLYNAKIIHYFGSNIGKKLPYQLTNIDLLTKFKKEEYIIPEIIEVINSPKIAFNQTLMISDEAIIKIIRTEYFNYLLKSYNEKSLLYKFINSHLRINGIVSVIWKKLLNCNK